MSNQVTAKKGLSVKDLVTTGIFTALLFVFMMVGGVFFATNPVLTFYMPAGSALLCGPIYLLMVAKVQKRWSLTIMCIDVTNDTRFFSCTTIYTFYTIVS